MAEESTRLKDARGDVNYGGTAKKTPSRALSRQDSSVFDHVATGDFKKTHPDGLTPNEASKRLEKYGPNELPEKSDSKLFKFLLEFVQPMPIIIWIAIGIEIALYFEDHEMNSLIDAGVLLVLQFLNIVIGFIEEMKASEEVAALKNSLKPEAYVIRNGVASKIKAREIVPGDIVLLAVGAAVPADCEIEDGEMPIQVDQSSMTGESMPVTMRSGDMAKMGSTVTAGECRAIVQFTGSQTFLGKTALLINTVKDAPHFEQVLNQLLIMLVVLGLTLCGLIFAFLVIRQRQSVYDVLPFTVVLLIASIPIALRVVCTCTLAVGCQELSKEGAIVARLSCIEEFAGMDILCSDKTGTLTLNKMALQEEAVTYEGSTRADLIKYAALAAKWWEPPKDALDALILGSTDCKALSAAGYEQSQYTPFDPIRKRTEAVVKKGHDTLRVMKGAPDVVLGLCVGNNSSIKDDATRKVDQFAKRGIRSLAVATAGASEEYKFLGFVTFLDPPRPDTKATIEKATEFGIGVKMITGDHAAIAMETSRVLGLGTNIENKDTLPEVTVDIMNDQNSSTIFEECGLRFEKTDGFAQVFPEHKYLIVEALRRRDHVVGMTGDGVNDAPALKRADVGIAVSGATDAARAASDIVLTQEGLSTIVSAVFVSRKIFQRMKNFVIYRVACTQQLLFFFFLSCILLDPSHIDSSYKPGYFSFPVMALVTITILNDGTIISVAYDKVDAHRQPEKWNLGALYIVSSAIGLSALFGSMLFLWLALGSNIPGTPWNAWFSLPGLSYNQVQTAVYLKISLSDYASVFNSRCEGWFWARAPSLIVLVAAVVAMGTSTLFSVIDLPWDLDPVSWNVVLFVWGYTLVWAVIQDIFKVTAYSILSKFGAYTAGELITDEEMALFQKNAATLRDTKVLEEP
jgi:H+-transporting ATPase